MLDSVSAPPGIVIRDLRRTIIIGKVGLSSDMTQYREQVQSVRQDHLGDSHVYDLDHLLDVNHIAFIGNDVGIELVLEAHDLQRTVGLFLPQPRTIFIFRVRKSEGWTIYVLYSQEQDGIIMTHLFLYNSNPKGWSWVGMSAIDRHTPHVPPAVGKYPRFSATVVVDTGMVPARREEDAAVGNLLIGIMVLLKKSDVVVITPAPWWPANAPAKPKAFETPNPSVSVVRVNTPRLLVRPPRDDDGSGAEVRPHHVRSHLRRRGNKVIQVRAHAKPRNRAPGTPVAKVVKIDEPL
jgi:hypothetical protein